MSSEDGAPNVGTRLAQESKEGAKDGRRRGGFKVGEGLGGDEVPSVSKVVGEEIKKKAADQDREPRYQEHANQDLVAKYRSGGKLAQNHQRESLKQEGEEEPYRPDAIEPEQVKEKEAVVVKCMT